MAVSVRPFLSIPLGFPALAFTPGGGAEILVEYGFGSPFHLHAGVGYQLVPFREEVEMLNLISIRGGAGLRWLLVPRVALRVYARGGVFTSISTDPQESVAVHACVMAGAGAQVRLTPRIGVLADAAYSLYVLKYHGISVHLGISIGLGPD